MFSCSRCIRGQVFVTAPPRTIDEVIQNARYPVEATCLMCGAQFDYGPTTIKPWPPEPPVLAADPDVAAVQAGRGRQMELPA